MMSHAAAFELFARTRPMPCLIGPRAIKLAQAVALHESSYGDGWDDACPAMVGSFNMGAIRGSPGHVCEDSHADGSSFTQSYRVYPSAEAGAAALWHELWRRPAVRRVLMDNALDVRSLAKAMRASGYFEQAESIYVKALQNAVKKIQGGT